MDILLTTDLLLLLSMDLRAYMHTYLSLSLSLSLCHSSFLRSHYSSSPWKSRTSEYIHDMMPHFISSPFFFPVEGFLLNSNTFIISQVTHTNCTILLLFITVAQVLQAMSDYWPFAYSKLQSFQELQNLATNLTVVARQLRIFRATESRLSAGPGCHLTSCLWPNLPVDFPDHLVDFKQWNHHKVITTSKMDS